ncbi:hypothetical protein BN1708_016807, partial [Verticillium longisporum]
LDGHAQGVQALVLGNGGRQADVVVAGAGVEEVALGVVDAGLAEAEVEVEVAGVVGLLVGHVVHDVLELVDVLAKHNTPESCWVVLYGDVYDVTDFLSSHPGGTKIILKLAGKDATEEYDPVHPPGTLEENLRPEAKLGRIKPDSITKAAPVVKAVSAADDANAPVRLETLLNLDDIEAAATKRISTKAHAYYFSAGDDLWSKSFNNRVYRQILLRPRMFRDCTQCDPSTTILGHKVGLPLFVAPAAMARLAHPDGEAGIARAAARFSAMQCVSNNASMTPEQVVAGAAPGQVFGWQLYVQNDRRKSEAMLRRINAMRDRYKYICLTLDAPTEEDKFNMAINSTIRSKGGVKAKIAPFAAVMYLEDIESHIPFVHLDFPETESVKIQTVNTTQEVTIPDMDAFTTFSTWLLGNETLRVTVEGKTHVKVNGISRKYGVTF